MHIWNHQLLDVSSSSNNQRKIYTITLKNKDNHDDIKNKRLLGLNNIKFIAAIVQDNTTNVYHHISADSPTSILHTFGSNYDNNRSTINASGVRSKKNYLLDIDRHIDSLD